MRTLILLSLFSLLLISCGGKQKSSAEPIEYYIPSISITDESVTLPDNRAENHYKILFYGNSHVIGIPQRLQVIINSALPDKTVITEVAPGSMYLDEHLNNPSSLALLGANNWNHVIFQAQKYSQSGTVEYPIDAAQTWVKRAKEHGAMAILYPEHPQAGNYLEGRRVHAIHQRIANNESACVAPIGLTWDRVIVLKPEIVLHRSDGNHASEIGMFLSALVFYQVITGEPADLVPYIDSLNIDEAQQSFLKQIASEVLATNPACEF